MPGGRCRCGSVDAYRAFFAAHCPELPPMPEEGLRRTGTGGFLRDVLLRHYLAVGSFCDYLDRFESDLTVIR